MLVRVSLENLRFRGTENMRGDRIRETPLKHRWPQSELAAKMQLAGITIERDSISRIENGTRFVPDYEIRVLSAIFAISVLWLLKME